MTAEYQCGENYYYYHCDRRDKDERCLFGFFGLVIGIGLKAVFDVNFIYKRVVNGRKTGGKIIGSKAFHPVGVKNTAAFSVVKGAFKAGTHLYFDLALGFCKQQQNAVVLVGAADAPAPRKVQRICVKVGSVHIVDRHNYHLSGSPFV